MKRKINRLNITKIVIFTVLFLFGRQVKATEYFTISLDSVNFNDTVVYCSGIDSIRIISPIGSTNVKWMINLYQDTIISKNLLLPEGSDGFISCQFSEAPAGAINFYIYPFFVEAGEDLTGTCGNNLQLTVNSNLKSSEILSYQWSPAQDISDPNIPNPDVALSGDEKYFITVTTLGGCQATDSVYVSLSSVNTPDICMVGVNDSNKNVIIWEKPALTNIDSVYIYKETLMTDQYGKIGTVDFDGSNSFIDTLSNPDIQSNKYKISLKDICGLESGVSMAHKTIHLSINQGQNNVWNLIWESYEGFPVTTYYIYRGTSRTNLELIGTSPASNTQYSDLTVPEGSVYYQIEIVSPNDCSILKSSSYSFSRSNIVSFENSSNINLILDDSKTSEIYPNPCEGEIIIVADDYKNSYVNIINSNGGIVQYARLNSLKTKLDISSIKPGIYFVQIITDKEIVTKKLLKKE
jgi:hypothetical protein